MNFYEYLNKYEIKKKYNILSCKEVYGGLVNKVYKITTINNQYIIKVINQYYIKNIDRYEMSEEISNICAKNGIAVANAIKINNRYINKVEDFYIMVFNYIEGEHIDISNIDENHIIKIAKMLGKIHKIKYTDNYKKIIRHSIDWDKFIKLPDFNNISYKEKYIDNYKNYNNIFDKVINIKNLKKEKLGICHRDIKTSNVIWKDNNPYLIDFESSHPF